LQNSTKILLPKAFSYREALIRKLLNILPRVYPVLPDFTRQAKIFTKIVPVGLLVLYLLGYQPVFSFPPVKKAIARAEDAQTQTVSAQFIPSFQLPHVGYISTRFSWFHPGLDIATGLNTPVHPVFEGTVENVLYGYFGYGNHVILDHGYGYKSLYGHMNNIYVIKDQKVSIDQEIGTVGLTGFTSGPHTHLEIIKDGKSINPEEVLPKLSDQPKEEFLTPVNQVPLTSPTFEPTAPTPSPEAEKLVKTLKVDL
jgi:murein DD-endopeptidase MepM/ murein hydrolase activator NlpD